MEISIGEVAVFTAIVIILGIGMYAVGWTNGSNHQQNKQWQQTKNNKNPSIASIRSLRDQAAEAEKQRLKQWATDWDI